MEISEYYKSFYQNKKNNLTYDEIFSVGNLVCLKMNDKRE